MSPVKALIIDKQPMMREALKAILTVNEGFEVVGETFSAEVACEMLVDRKPDVVLAGCIRDYVLGSHFIRRACLLNVTSRFIVFVDPLYSTPAEIHKVMSNTNVSGVLTPDVSPEEIKTAVRKVLGGDYFIDGRITDLLISADSLYREFNLSLRQLQILKMIADGYTNKKISSELGISHDTVKTHVRMVLKKLDAADRAQAVSKAYQIGILQQTHLNTDHTN